MLCPMEYTLRHTRRRRTMALVMLPDGTLEVRAPKGVRKGVVEAFVAERAAWINKHRTRQESWPSVAPRTWQSGEVFYLHGEPYTLNVVTGGKVAVSVGETTLTLAQRDPENPVRVRHNLAKWYCDEALGHFTPRVAELADVMGEAAPHLAISTPRQRWGSCIASRAQVRLAHRLLMTPPDVQDYVIIHELSHLKHMDHSAAFWARVETFCPRYKAYEKALRVNNRLWTFDT